MKNKLYISLLAAIPLCLGYTMIGHHNEPDNNSSKNSSYVSKDTDYSHYTNQKTSTSNENHSIPSNIATSNISKNNIGHLEPLLEVPPKKENINNNSSALNSIEPNKTIITISEFLNNSDHVSYSLKPGETLTQVARNYENTCNLNTTIKLIKTINHIHDAENLDIGYSFLIPEYIIKNGKMYPITKGETWYNIVNKYYANYDVESMTKLLIFINDLPNKDLPLGESIFLPSI